MTDWDREAEPWLTRFTPAAAGGGRIQLVCLPHAGGSATFFAPLAREMPPSAEVLAVQYPGRQERRNEPAVEDISELADRIARALEHAGEDAPLVLFGHSMGALLAWEVARRLEARTATQPAGLIVSGRGAPSVHRDVRLHHRSDAELVADLRYLSGTAGDLLADPEMLRMVLPVLRSDYKAVDGYRYHPAALLRCPVSVFAGESDPWAPEKQCREWREEAAGPVAFRSFPGDHFYLSAQWPQVARAVAETFAGAAAG